MSYARTLILNQNYRPHEIVDWKEAVTKMFGGDIQVLIQYDEILASIDRQTLRAFPELAKSLRSVVGTDVVHIDVKVPAVAVLNRPVKMVKSGIKFSKINMCLRDKFRCQYCGGKFKMSELNYDHVVPRAQGGKTTWNNIVMSCYPCNGRKADRTPDQAGMTLLTVPTKPKVLPMNEPIIDPTTSPEEWQQFIAA